MEAFQGDAFQTTGFQASGSTGSAHAFQTCAFQFGAFQTGRCRPEVIAATGGGIIKKKRQQQRVNFSLAEQGEDQRKEERIRLGIIPKEVKSVIRRVAKESIDALTSSEKEQEAALRYELDRAQIAYQAIYARMLAQEREVQVDRSIKRLMQMEMDSQIRQAQHREEMRRQQEEEDIAFLLMSL